MRIIENYVICFMVYCVVGWFWETIPNSYRAKKFVNRGFLNGPVIPIYGVGALLVWFVLGYEHMGIFPLFLSAGLLTVTLEYLTSWAMEKLFHARWWDYSNKPFNLNGRIYLTGFIAFGGFSVIVIKWAQPSLMAQVEKLSDISALIISVLFIVSFLTDLIITTIHVCKIPQRLHQIELEINKFKEEHNYTSMENAFKEYLRNSTVANKLGAIEKELHSFQAKRITNAFPNIKLQNYQDIFDSIKKSITDKKKQNKD